MLLRARLFAPVLAIGLAIVMLLHDRPAAGQDVDGAQVRADGPQVRAEGPQLRADGPQVRAEKVAEGLTAPVFLTEPDDGSGRRFVVDQVGRITILGENSSEPFLDISDQLVALDTDYDERGLLGLAFHPDYRENGRFFVYYSAPAREEAPDGWDHTNQLSEFRVSEDDPDRADPASERIVMEIDQPYSNHNGGHITFGHDGFLYVPLGDGGNGGDVDAAGEDLGRPERGNAQTLTTLHGKVLRIDVDGEQPYAIPPDNPFAGSDGGERPEIWAYGFRNPYGLSVDRETGDLYAADAGQALFEEIDRVRRGGNFGWNVMEGPECFDPEDYQDPPEDCRDTGYRGEPLIGPTLTYQRSPNEGSSVVPGVRYRGDDLPELRGRVVFGDYARIRFWPEGVLYAGTVAGGTPGRVEEIRVANAVEGRADGELNRFLLSVVQDRDGELYALTTLRGGPEGSTGAVLALRPVDAASVTPWWAWLLVGAGVVAAGLTAVWFAARHRERRRPAS